MFLKIWQQQVLCLRSGGQEEVSRNILYIKSIKNCKINCCHKDVTFCYFCRKFKIYAFLSQNFSLHTCLSQNFNLRFFLFRNFLRVEICSAANFHFFCLWSYGWYMVFRTSRNYSYYPSSCLCDDLKKTSQPRLFCPQARDNVRVRFICLWYLDLFTLLYAKLQIRW